MTRAPTSARPAFAPRSRDASRPAIFVIGTPSSIGITLKKLKRSDLNGVLGVTDSVPWAGRLVVQDTYLYVTG